MNNQSVNKIFILMSVLIICKLEYQLSKPSDLEKKIQGKHTDYYQLFFLIQILTESNLSFEFCSWKELRGKTAKFFDLIIIPQQMFLAGKIPDSNSIIQDLIKFQQKGVNFLFLHHPDGLFIQSEFLNVNLMSYKTDRVDKYEINNFVDSGLIAGLDKIINTPSSTTEEFTYCTKVKSSFIPILSKTPQVQLHPGIEKYICYGFQPLRNNNYTFFIDIHGTGSKRGINGFLFQKIIKNILGFIFEHDSDSVLEDKEIKKIVNSKIPETEKKALLKSRIGQGKFRSDLIKYWKICSLTGFKNTELLKASHIKPWAASTNKERLDVFNGLLLLPNLDTCFDKGFITFDNDGSILISNKISEEEITQLGLKKSFKLLLHRYHIKYLEYHRTIVFKK